MKRILLASSFVVLCTVSNAQVAHLVMDSEPGDFIGQGQHWDITYTPQNSSFFFANINDTDSNGLPTGTSFVLGTVTGGSDNTFALIDFSTRKLNVPFGPGTYLNAMRYPFEDPNRPGLNVSFQNRGSNTLTGEFSVTDFTWHDAGGGSLVIDSLAASFVQHSEGATPKLTGTFTYNVVPEPATLLGCGIALLALRKRRKQ